MECVFSFGELLLVVVLLPLLVDFYQSSRDVFLCCCIGCCDVFDRLAIEEKSSSEDASRERGRQNRVKHD